MTAWSSRAQPQTKDTCGVLAQAADLRERLSYAYRVCVYVCVCVSSQVEDVTDDGLVTKKTLIESEEWKRPNEGATVTVKLTGRLADGTVFLSYPEGSELTFVTDENQVCVTRTQEHASLLRIRARMHTHTHTQIRN